MLRPRGGAGRHTSQRSSAAGQFGKAAQVAGVVGGAEKIRPAGELRDILGWIDQSERK